MPVEIFLGGDGGTPGKWANAHKKAIVVSKEAMRHCRVYATFSVAQGRMTSLIYDYREEGGS